MSDRLYCPCGYPEEWCTCSDGLWIPKDEKAHGAPLPQGGKRVPLNPEGALCVSLNPPSEDCLSAAVAEQGKDATEGITRAYFKHPSDFSWNRFSK